MAQEPEQPEQTSSTPSPEQEPEQMGPIPSPAPPSPPSPPVGAPSARVEAGGPSRPGALYVIAVGCLVVGLLIGWFVGAKLTRASIHSELESRTEELDAEVSRRLSAQQEVTTYQQSLDSAKQNLLQAVESLIVSVQGDLDVDSRESTRTAQAKLARAQEIMSIVRALPASDSDKAKIEGLFASLVTAERDAYNETEAARSEIAKALDALRILRGEKAQPPPEETTAPPEGTTTPPEGAPAPPEGTTTPPEGAPAPPEGTTTPPQGTTSQPEGTAPPARETTPQAGGTTPPANR